MENVRLSKLHPVIRAQDAKMEGLRQIVQKEHAKNQEKMVKYAKEAQGKAAYQRSLKHDFTIDAYGDPAPDSVFVDVVASLRDDRTGWVLHRLPTRIAMEVGRQARRDNVERIIDLLV